MDEKRLLKHCGLWSLTVFSWWWHAELPMIIIYPIFYCLIQQRFLIVHHRRRTDLWTFGLVVYQCQVGKPKPKHLALSVAILQRLHYLWCLFSGSVTTVCANWHVELWLEAPGSSPAESAVKWGEFNHGGWVQPNSGKLWRDALWNLVTAWLTCKLH